MSDLIYVAVLVVFFVLCAFYVRLCDHMIGTDDPGLADTAADSHDSVSDSHVDDQSDADVTAS